jgi:cell wall assembly regulator SMI1
MTPPRVWKQYRCRSCGAVLPAWLPVFQEPNGAMLLSYLAQDHPDQVGQYLAQMHTDEDHDRVVGQAFEVMEDPAPESP